MYADREEARNSRHVSGGAASYRSSHTPELDAERKRPRTEHASDRERELQEQLRKRALASRANGDATDRDAPRSSRSRSPASSQRSASRSRSRDSYRSRRSYPSKSRSSRADDEADDRRKRRREERDAYERRSRRRDREPADDDNDDGEEARERRRRRGERDDHVRDRDHRSHSGRRGADTYDAFGRYDRDRHASSYYGERDRSYYDRERDNGYGYGGGRRGPSFDDDRRAPRSGRASRYDSPARSTRSHRSPSPGRREAEEYEERSVFCSQLAARLTQRDLGEFFEESLGEGAVKDVRIVMDRVTRRSRGVGYVEFADKELVPKAMTLSGSSLYGIPILVQKTDAARNRGEQGDSDLPHRPNMLQPSALPRIDPAALAGLALPPQLQVAGTGTGAPIHLNFGGGPGGPAAGPGGVPRSQKPGPNHPNAAARLYVGSLHFSLTDENVQAVFEPFGEVEYVDLHREPGTGKSKGFAFVQFKEPDDAKKALESMNGFELAGRTIRVGPVNARGTGGGGQQQGSFGPGAATGANTDLLGTSGGGQLPTLTSSYDDGGGAGLNPEKRAVLMQKLARTDSPSDASTERPEQERPASIPQSVSTSLLLKNMFNPEEETERDWDLDLAEDVKDECQSKYGPVTAIHVEKESAGEICVTFADTDSSSKAMAGLNGRWFGGKPISAQYISDAFVKARQG